MSCVAVMVSVGYLSPTHTSSFFSDIFILINGLCSRCRKFLGENGEWLADDVITRTKRLTF